ncbi:MAG: hypothetical protein SO188_12690 [Prevotella sp.]|nr:hypothetical protein [Prevotella sp.]MDY4853647.1 hypothetical protein [Prevotella sp.]
MRFYKTFTYLAAEDLLNVFFDVSNDLIHVLLYIGVAIGFRDFNY